MTFTLPLKLSPILLAALAASLLAQTPIPATPPVSSSPATLPGRGLAQHDLLYCGEWYYTKPLQTLWIIRRGKPVWSYSIPYHVVFNGKPDIQELGDCALLANGNVVFSTRLGAEEVTPAKQVVWQIIPPPGAEIHSIQPIGLDHVLVAQNGNPARLLLIDTATNTIEKDIPIPVRDPLHPHGQLRRARITPAGTFLVAHMDLNKVSEYDSAGKEIWSYATPGPWSANRLPNGNTLITGDAHGYIKEVNPAGEVVWQIDRSNLPGYTIGNIQDAARLPNGDTVFSNWVPNAVKSPAGWPSTVQLIEVTPAKKIVWALRSWTNPDLGPATGFQILNPKYPPLAR